MFQSAIAGQVEILVAARAHIGDVAAVIQLLDLASLDRIAALLHKTFQADGTVYTMGNGGSAATAIHFATDLARLTRTTGGCRELRVVALNGNAASLTACANDFGFENAFLEQLRGLIRPGDAVVGISTSGQSANVVRALEYAKNHGAASIALTRTGSTPLRAASDEALQIPSTDVQVIEDASMVAAHLLCRMLHHRRVAAGD
jgi:D-sedoheptulose 7-phosphate isomerase